MNLGNLEVQCGSFFTQEERPSTIEILQLCALVRQLGEAIEEQLDPGSYGVDKIIKALAAYREALK